MARMARLFRDQHKGSLMADVKFAAGQHVSLVGVRSFSVSAPRGVFRIVSALPKDSGPQQYRVRSDGEAHDRVVEESALEATGL
jgi:hypothetical protein